VPTTQTCCGQPGYNSGDRSTAQKLARKLIREFESVTYVVAPSGSCAAMVCEHYPKLFEANAADHEAAKLMAAKTYELSDFLVNVAKIESPAAKRPRCVTYHDCCSGLRELNVKQQPRTLLTSSGASISELRDPEACCGFGGAFSIKFPEVSTAIADRKCDDIVASGAKEVVLGDLGCMLNIEGRLRRRGCADIKVVHIAEALTEGDQQ
jgi:L-lactate dehydrogenase complex protein LldE